MSNDDKTRGRIFISFFSAQAMEKCHNSETCLCGSDSSIAEREVNILEYQLFADKSKSFKMTVIAGTGV